jgi:hypothetical protein
MTIGDLYAYQDIETYVLLLVGIIFAIIIMIDVLKLDDVFPGYGDVDRRYHAQRDRFALDVAGKIADLEGQRNRAIDTLDQLKKEFATRRHHGFAGSPAPFAKFQSCNCCQFAQNSVSTGRSSYGSRLSYWLPQP